MTALGKVNINYSQIQGWQPVRRKIVSSIMQVANMDSRRIFEVPVLTEDEIHVLGELEEMRGNLGHIVREPRRWSGVIRKLAVARAIRGSNSIEGIHVSLDDALAVVEGEEPLNASDETRLAVRGYREALTYILQLADDPHFEYEPGLVRGLHYMILNYDLPKRPGRWRLGDVFVLDESTKEIVYQGPPAEWVPDLIELLVEDLRSRGETYPSLVNAAMAHLNLAMIHPFKDGNGRMARALQTLVLARDGILAPEFSSLEEYLGTIQPEYYRVLSEVGAGSWQPSRSAKAWVRFVLTAHHKQLQILFRRMNEYERLWDGLEALVTVGGLPERAIPSLFNACVGVRIRNPMYRQDADVSEYVAGRDLKALVAVELLEPHGERRGRYYTASPVLRDLRQQVQEQRQPLRDPFGATQPSLPLSS